MWDLSGVCYLLPTEILRRGNQSVQLTSQYLETIPTNFPHRAQWSLCSLEQTPFSPGEIWKEMETPDSAQVLMDISQS